MFLPRSNDHVFCLLRVDGHEVISIPIDHLVRRKLECRKNIIVSVMPQLPKSNLAVLSKWEKKYFCLYNV